MIDPARLREIADNNDKARWPDETNDAIDELREAADEIDRLTVDMNLAKAKAAYWEHDADCCGGCSECLRLARELTDAEKARQT